MRAEREKIRRIILALFEESHEDLLDRAQIAKAYCYANIEALRNMRRPVCLWPVVRMPNGPGIDQHTDILAEMVEDGWLDSAGNHLFRRGRCAPTTLNLHEEERECIRAGWKHIEGKSFEQLRQESHGLASYRQAESGAPMLLETDAFADDPPRGPPGFRISDEDWKKWKKRALSRR